MLAGTDATVFNFLQEYVPSLLGLDTSNLHFRKNIQIYLTPSEQNTLCSYIAAREPLYRNNVFQFFSNMNPVYKAQVKVGGNIQEARTAEELEMQAITEQVLQNYFKEASRTVEVKIFKA